MIAKQISVGSVTYLNDGLLPEHGKFPPKASACLSARCGEVPGNRPSIQLGLGIQAVRNVALFVAVIILIISLAEAADFVLVVDVSGSMQTAVAAKGGKSRIVVVQEALRNYIIALPLGSRVMVVAFNDGLEEREALLNAESDREGLLRWIDSFQAEVKRNRGTRLYQTLRHALEVAREYARQNPHQFVQLIALTDGEDDSRVPAERAIPELLRDFPEVEKSLIQANLVLTGDWTTALIVRLEEKLRSSGIEVTDASDLSQPMFPPVIVQSPEPAEARQDVLFGENSTTPFVAYQWFLDGQSAGREKSLRVRFDQSGSRRVAVEGITTKGKKLRAEKSVQVLSNALSVSFTFFPGLPEPQQETHFFSRASGKAIRWQWIVNGRLHAEGQDMAVRFPATGTNEVRVAVTDALGFSVSFTNWVEVRESEISMRFTVPPVVVSGQVVQFVNETLHNNLRFLWDFGDGHNSNDRNPQHVFELAGDTPREFTVHLRGIRSTGLIVDAAPRTIRVVPPQREPPPIAAFRILGTNWKARLPVDLGDETRGLTTNYFYDFNGEGTATNRNPSFIFQSLGRKVIRQQVDGPGGRSWATNVISVEPLYIAPSIASFAAAPTNGRAPLRCDFAASAKGDFSGVRWLVAGQIVSTNLSFVYSFNVATQAEVTFLVLPKEPGAAAISKVVRVSVSRPVPAWLKWLPAILAVCVAGRFLARRLCPKPLLGELQWEFAGQRGRMRLSGAHFGISDLNIPGWKPAKSYVIRNRQGHRIIADGVVELELSHKKNFRLEGVSFTYLNEAA